MPNNSKLILQVTKSYTSNIHTEKVLNLWTRTNALIYKIMIKQNQIKSKAFIVFSKEYF